MIMGSIGFYRKVRVRSFNRSKRLRSLNRIMEGIGWILRHGRAWYSINFKKHMPENGLSGIPLVHSCRGDFLYWDTEVPPR